MCVKNGYCCLEIFSLRCSFSFRITNVHDSSDFSRLLWKKTIIATFNSSLVLSLGQRNICFIVGLIGGILAYSFDLGALLSIIIGVAAYALMEVKFRLFLKKQTQIPNFKPKERPLRLLTAASEETKKIYMKIAAYLLFGILIILLPFSEGGYDDLMKAMCIALGILAIGVSLFQVRALFYKKANPSLTDKK